MDIEIKNVFVSSTNRDLNLYPSGNTYTLFLTNQIKQIKKVELMYASVPNTLLNLTNGSNVISFSNLSIGQQSSDTGLTNFSLPPGFYGASGLATEITNAVSNLATISMTYLASEGKYLISRPTSTGPFTMDINTNEMALLLGFPTSMVGTMIQSTNVAVQSSLNVPLYSDNTTYRDLEFVKSSQIVSLNVSEGVFLDIEELRTICNEDADKINTGSSGTTSGQNVSRTFGIIPMDVSSGVIKRFKKATDYDSEVMFPYPIQKIDRLTVRWTDINGKLINFNGLDNNSFLLRFHVIPSK